LRAGSGTDTDELLAQFSRFWESEETRLGCDIDLRVLAVASSRRSEIDQLVRAVLLRIDPARQPNENQVFNLLQSLLWLDCSNACPDCIEKWFPYADHVAPSRALLAYLYRANEHAIQYGSENWWVDARHQLERESVAT